MRQKGFAPLILIIILAIIGIVGYLGYKAYWNLGKGTKTGGSTVSISTPVSTVNWKTYTNEDLSFQYPADWLKSGIVISPDMPGVPHNDSYPYMYLNVFGKGSTLKSNAITFNGCMEEISVQATNGVFVKKFKPIAIGLCKDGNQTFRLMWIVPSATTYGPGVTINYYESDAEQVEQIVAQILSTFKFTN